MMPILIKTQYHCRLHLLRNGASKFRLFCSEVFKTWAGEKSTATDRFSALQINQACKEQTMGNRMGTVVGIFVLLLFAEREGSMYR
jgi:hypothetical protein